MGVPEEIRKVERPKNTIIIRYGKNKDRYAVRQRTGCRSVNGRKIPVEGPIIGHIVDGKYVPKDTNATIHTSACDYKQWANIICATRSARISSRIFCPRIQQPMRKRYSVSPSSELWNRTSTITSSVRDITKPGCPNYTLTHPFLKTRSVISFSIWAVPVRI